MINATSQNYLSNCRYNSIILYPSPVILNFQQFLFMLIIIKYQYVLIKLHFTPTFITILANIVYRPNPTCPYVPTSALSSRQQTFKQLITVAHTALRFQNTSMLCTFNKWGTNIHDTHLTNSPSICPACCKHCRAMNNLSTSLVPWKHKHNYFYYHQPTKTPQLY